PAQANNVGVDAAGNILIIGYGRDASNNTNWLVRKSIDHGGSWTIPDQFLRAGGTDSEGSFVGASKAGNLFAGGGASDRPAGRREVGKGGKNGTTWSTVDDFLHPGGTSTSNRAYNMAQDGSGALFVVGASNSNSAYHWLVRKSVDEGVTWTTVDDFVYPAGI